MIVVKATYRNETRKFSFEYNSLPTYYDLQTQLCRVFPSLNFRSFYLSQLLFSPNASQPGHILIAQEVHDLEGYSASTKPHQRYFVNALLKFTVKDKQHSESDLQSTVSRSSSLARSSVASLRSNSSTARDSIATNTPPADTNHTLVESIDQMNSSIDELKKNLDKLTAATLGRSTDPCSICKRPVGGLRYSCRNCDAVVCSSCTLKGDYFCTVTTSSHSLNLAVTGQSTDSNNSANSAPPAPGSFSMPSPISSRIGPFPSPPSAPAAFPDVTPQPPSDIMEVDDATRSSTPTLNMSAPPPPPVIHEGIRCDGCQNIVEGTRHKCLDCPDYDMCSRCVVAGGLDDHEISHEWISLDKPTLVIIHKPTTSASSATQPPQSSPVHDATCDLCDSVVVGHRYKCTVCPDFDTCKGCFSIVGDQHPHHTFVKVADPSHYIAQRGRPRPRHAAFCDVCRKTIFGVRYKCMHAQCPDFDLCENCEALPIPQHPTSHPLLKIRSPDVTVPSVNRSGQSQVFSENVPSQTPITAPQTVHASPVAMPKPRVKLPGGNVPFSESTSFSARAQSPCNEDPLATPPRAWTSYKEDALATPPRAQSPCKEDAFATPPSNIPEPLPSTPQDSDAEKPTTRSADPEPTLASSAVGLEPSVLFQIVEPVQTDAVVSPSISVDGAADVANTSVEFAPSPWATWDAYRGLNDLIHSDPSDIIGEKSSVASPRSDDSESFLVTFDREETYSSRSDSPIVKQETPEAPALPPLDSPPALPSDLFAPALTESSVSTLLGNAPPVFTPSVPDTTAPVTETEVGVGANLSASCMGDVTVPDGQVFPPGSTFMKCWKIINDGDTDWPNDTEISFVGGDSFHGGRNASFAVGGAKPGEIRNAWTGELKAPERPGRYMSYWRLRDGSGNAFGQPIWIDIEVLEPMSESLDGNLSSSSVVVMPTMGTPVAPNDSPRSTSTGLTIATDDDDAFSDTSFASVGSSSEDEDAELWTDSRRQIPSAQQGSQAVDYVLLYDDNSSDDEF